MIELGDVDSSSPRFQTKREEKEKTLPEKNAKEGEEEQRRKVSDVQKYKPSPGKTSPMLFVTLASIIASVGGILFGYDIGIISGALLLLRTEFSLSCFEQELVVSAVLFGALCASFFGGSIVDHFGRKMAILLSSFLFILGTLILTFGVTLYMVIAGRFIVGIAVSISVTAECTYITEISPSNRRGMLVSLNEVGITVGFLLAYLLNYIFISKKNGWRYMFGAAIGPAVLQAIGIIFMPKSPHFLIMSGKIKEAEVVLKTLRKKSNTEGEIKTIVSNLEEEKNRRYVDLFSSSNNMRGRMALGMVLVFFQQFSGQANVLYYAPTVFQYFGYCSDTSATLVTVGLGIVKVVATLFTVLIVDKLGRRLLLLVGCILMGTSILALGLVTMIEPHNISTVKCSSPEVYSQKEKVALEEPSLDSKTTLKKLLLVSNVTKPFSSIQDGGTLSDDKTSDFGVSKIENDKKTCTNCSNLASSKNETFFENDTDTCSNVKNISPVMKYISIIALMAFVWAYGISYGPVTWLVLSEIFPTSLRGRAISIATLVNWGSNIIVSLSFLTLLENLGVGETFLIYGCVCFGAACFVFLCIPETKNKSLEEITCQLSQGFLQRKIRPNISSMSRKYTLTQTKL